MQLRFSKQYKPYSSPVMLRFGGVPVDPPEPIKNWLWLMAHTHTQQHSNLVQQRLTNRAGRLQLVMHAQATAWQVQTAILNVHGIANTHLHSNAALYSFTQKALSDKANFTSLRTANLLPLMLSADLNWRQGLTHYTHVVAAIRLGVVKLNQQVLTHGPTSANWICVPTAHPEKGKVILRLRETSAPSLRIRFRDIDKVCRLQVRGSVSALTEQPVLNSKLPITPQIANTYMSKPTVSCVRVSDGAVIFIAAVSITHSREQFAASVNITYQTKTDAERAHNQLLKITLNGNDFYVLSEKPSKALSFGSQSYTSQGRTRLAELSEPYQRDITYTNTVAKSAAGVMSDLLAGTDWQLHFGMVDFAIAANTITIANKTPASALLHCAKAIGGMLQVDDALKKVTVLPRWPVSPWLISSTTPDIVLHESHIHSYSEQYNEQASANGVFIAGQQNGVMCKIKREGSSGDLLLPDVVEPMITHVQAARQRGTCELANAGSEYQISISTDLTQAIAHITPGMLVGVQFSDVLLKATCQSCTVSATVSANGAIDIEQQLVLIAKE